MVKGFAEKIRKMKGKEKIVMLTAYDAIFSSYLNEAGTDIILVGDSLGNVWLGFKNTKPVTMEHMLHHTRAVARTNPEALVVGDMPFKSYEGPQQAVKNARAFIEAGANAVKIEGPKIEIVEELKKNRIDVMGHVGLTPQTSDWKVQGRKDEEAKRILDDAIALDRAGCFSIVVESVPAVLGKKITNAVKAPTIGIGAGADCDGQVLVSNDLIGLNAADFKPKFVKQYLNLRPEIIAAFKRFKEEVKAGKFPTKEFSYE